MLINGRWSREDLPRDDGDGDFVRPRSIFRDWLGSEPGQLPAVAGRYHLFVNAGCPWAYRTILYRALKGLEELVSISFTRPAAGAEGWTFGDPEPLLGARHVHEIYREADATVTCRATVPVLWDRERGTIVSNESADIIRMFNSAFDGLEGVREADFYPKDLADEIDALNELIYENVNNGVYRCGFARSQAAYDAAYDRLFDTLDALDERLAARRYLCGDVITEADWRLFSTLVRFDLAYYGRFSCNRQRIVDFDNLWPYTRDLYQQPGVAETVDVGAIKGIYYGAGGVLPKGPVLDFAAAHDRERLSL
jgi:putative glutathione S-transferase